jgi:hypothetical protein
MIEIAVNLRNHSAEDFYKMFTELNDYKYEGKEINSSKEITEYVFNDYDYKANEIGTE